MCAEERSFSEEQPVVILHEAGIRILPAVSQVIENAFSPAVATRRRSQPEDSAAAQVTCVRTSKDARAVEVATWVDRHRSVRRGGVSAESGEVVEHSLGPDAAGFRQLKHESGSIRNAAVGSHAV